MSRSSIFLSGLVLSFVSGVACAQDSPVPGEARGTIDGLPFSVALDCRSWDAEQRMVYSAGDNRSSTDANGDGVVFTFNHFAPAAMTDGTLTIDGRTIAINAGFRPGPDDPRWEVSDTQAIFSGPSFGQESAQVDITVDCAPRSAVTRGFTGRVTGTIDDQTVDEPLFCGNWNQPDAIEARTEENVGDAQASVFVMRSSGNGTVEVTTDKGEYQIVAAPIAGTAFDLGDDTVSLQADLTNRQTGNSYSVDLTFACKED
ncbi:hypothetical protein [Yoonia sediminilitoris]|uniref:Carboxypeptidase regulatory-like domain-containing protein n=1 Tax=Yoonia sediminilitoris TaxID=1286148 RepID=A0A2T6KHB8_9RHOB|nr:hypothetical protein [Yoonia sediminilitoris]PUB14910.1 hypothetical protein C8N45_105133 [Yoonia sediminilitoris]RCW95627.1 hypothetical protein DFP92_105133 [Yoonia sediminilitoris]